MTWDFSRSVRKFLFHYLIFTNVLRKCVCETRENARRSLQKLVVYILQNILENKRVRGFSWNFLEKYKCFDGEKEISTNFVKIDVFFVKFHVFTKKVKGIFVSTLPHPTCLLSHKISIYLAPPALNWPTIYVL